MALDELIIYSELLNLFFPCGNSDQEWKYLQLETYISKIFWLVFCNSILRLSTISSIWYKQNLN